MSPDKDSEGIEKSLGTTGCIGRFKPLHLGGLAMLTQMCMKGEYVHIGIGSSNKYNMRNPFTAEETEEMLRYALEGYHNFDVIHIPDSGHDPRYRDGQKWKEDVKREFGELDTFVCGNRYVIELLKDDYRIIQPMSIIPAEYRAPISSTMVRIELARHGDWQSLVPEKIAEYISQNGLDERFRKEFGLETLAALVDFLPGSESEKEERMHTYEC